MPVATSPSAMPLTSSGWSLQNSAIWSKVNEVLSTSQTAVALGISGASLIVSSPYDRPAARVRSQARRRRSLKQQNSGGMPPYRGRGAKLQWPPAALDAAPAGRPRSRLVVARGLRFRIERPARPGGDVERVDAPESQPLDAGPGDHRAVVGA